jgi:oligopeptide/dipeptide ABC transporter ATP-binding protein
MSDALLEVRDLVVVFDTPTGTVRAVDGVSFDVAAGSALGLVGESGCGKSLTALALLALTPPHGRIAGGSVRFQGRDLLTLPDAELRRVRGSALALVFQEPAAALNPVYTVGDQIGEVLRVHRGADRRAAKRAAIGLLERVGIPDAVRRVDAWPHELSGGMKQRVCIAMALACTPALLIADEPTTALDVTIQAQILDLLASLRRDEGLAILLISHDLGVVGELCDQVAVMYSGRIVERGPANVLLERPRHPYTRGLLRSRPRLDSVRAADGRLPAIPGQVPEPRDRPSGCAFHPRCALAQADCRAAVPPLLELAAGHAVACPYSDRDDLGGALGGGRGGERA